MPLTQRHRSKLHDTLSPIVGEDTIEALLAEFPATELDRPVTEGFVRAEIAELRTELKADIAGVHEDILRLDASVSERLRQLTMWMTGMLFAGIGASTAIATAIARLVG